MQPARKFWHQALEQEFIEMVSRMANHHPRDRHPQLTIIVGVRRIATVLVGAVHR